MRTKVGGDRPMEADLDVPFEGCKESWSFPSRCTPTIVTVIDSGNQIDRRLIWTNGLIGGSIGRTREEEPHRSLSVNPGRGGGDVMRAEIRREFPIGLKQAWDYLVDWRMFPQWRVGMVDVLDPETAAWSKPGDKFRFAYRMLGRTVEGESVLEEAREHELMRFTSSVPGLGTVTETWRYQNIDDDLFAISVVMEGSEPTNFFGKLIDHTLMPRVVERDLHRTLDNLHDIFTMGVPG